MKALKPYIYGLATLISSILCVLWLWYTSGEWEIIEWRTIIVAILGMIVGFFVTDILYGVPVLMYFNQKKNN